MDLRCTQLSRSRCPSFCVPQVEVLGVMAREDEVPIIAGEMWRL
jgi:hypothetical protein